MTRAALSVALLLLTLAPMPVLAQEGGEVEISGTVEHGGDASSFDPTQARVTMNVLEGVTLVSQQTALPDAAGAFSFTAAATEGREFFFSVEYQGASYSAFRDAGRLADPVVVTVFDATHDTAVLTVQSHTVIVTGAVPDEGFVEILERAIVRNDSGLTLTPDLNAQGPAMLSFMRFALPPGAYNLDVRSNIVGGQVLTVDRGFALNSPIPPTASGQPHQFEFVYRLDYDKPTLDLSRTMRFGAESVRFVVPVDVATPSSSRLTDLGATDFDGRLLRLLEGQDIAPAEVLDLSVSGLPKRSAFDVARESAGEWYVRYTVPAAVGATVAFLLLSLLRRKRMTVVGATREQLLAEARALREAYDRRDISTAVYQGRSRDIREALVQVEVQQRLTASDD
ncbi:MAG: hypothetical protein OXL97_08160 [Chloroflexota bacterium]|nr:hypothetical protein [Chloroflexota bacterium]MDE2883852.1 hypothetical protein [Chloroflexota bacterium]